MWFKIKRADGEWITINSNHIMNYYSPANARHLPWEGVSNDIARLVMTGNYVIDVACSMEEMDRFVCSHEILENVKPLSL